MGAEEALRAVRDPLLKRDVVSLGYVRGLTASGSRVRFTLRLPSPASPYGDALAVQCREALLALDEDRKSTRLNPSHKPISYAVFCMKKKK